MADTWRRAGVDVRQRLTSEVENEDRQFRSTFPALLGRGTELEELTNLGKLQAAQASGPANRWAGNNRGSWISPQFDESFDIVNSSLDRDARSRAAVAAMKLVSDELPIIMMYYNNVVQAHVAALRGPDTYAPGAVRTWNIHEWELR